MGNILRATRMDTHSFRTVRWTNYEPTSQTRHASIVGCVHFWATLHLLSLLECWPSFLIPGCLLRSMVVPDTAISLISTAVVSSGPRMPSINATLRTRCLPGQSLGNIEFCVV